MNIIYKDFNGSLDDFLKQDIEYFFKVDTILKLLNNKQKIKFAILCDESVLHIFEDKYPEDKRPRKAIEAAKQCLENNDHVTRELAKQAEQEALSSMYATQYNEWCKINEYNCAEATAVEATVQCSRSAYRTDDEGIKAGSISASMYAVYATRYRGQVKLSDIKNWNESIHGKKQEELNLQLMLKCIG